MFGCLVALLQHTPRFEAVYRAATRVAWLAPGVIVVSERFVGICGQPIRSLGGVYDQRVCDCGVSALVHAQCGVGGGTGAEQLADGEDWSALVQHLSVADAVSAPVERWGVCVGAMDWAVSRELSRGDVDGVRVVLSGGTAIPANARVGSSFVSLVPDEARAVGHACGIGPGFLRGPLLKAVRHSPGVECAPGRLRLFAAHLAAE